MKQGITCTYPLSPPMVTPRYCCRWSNYYNVLHTDNQVKNTYADFISAPYYARLN